MNKIIKSYFEMPEATLLALAELDFKKSLDIELKIVEDWIKNKRCKCAEHPDIQNKKVSLDCDHINKKINKKINKIEEQLKLKSDALLLRNLTKLRKVQQRLNAF